MVTNIVVGGEDVGLLFGEELTEGERKLLGEGVGVDTLGLVFAAFGGGEQGVFVGGVDLLLEIEPHALECTGGGSLFVDVVDAVAVEFVFEFSAEVGALEGFGEEVAFQGLIFQVATDVGEALLPVFEDVDDFFDYFFEFGVFFDIGWHGFLLSCCGALPGCRFSALGKRNLSLGVDAGFGRGFAS